MLRPLLDKAAKLSAAEASPRTGSLQMVLAVVMDGEGRPVGTEMWPGNTADVTVLMPIVDRLRARFAIGRVYVVADRGTISEVKRR